MSCVAAVEYEYPVDAAIRALKFHGRLSCIPAFAGILLTVAPALPGDIDALLPVPLHRWRYAKRGFNQADELARSVARQLHLPVINNARRIIATPYQSGLDAHERRENLSSAFDVRGVINAKHVVIVDDVVTTGETCRQLANTVLASGVEKVSVLALARA
ncbi:MAG: ComF family protein [Woeseiaceae bacterium]|nr:ComF family protein [Woeseiaceae bacterium]